MKSDHRKWYEQDLEQAAAADLPWNSLNGKYMLITGATGMIGKALIDLIMYRNKKTASHIFVLAMGRSQQKAMQRFSGYWDNPHFRFIEHNIHDALKHNEILRTFPADYMIHAASTTHPIAYASQPVETITSNIIGLYNLMEYAGELGIRKAAFLSSVEVYGENRGDTDKFTEDYCGYLDCNTLRAGYPESKRAGEALCQAYAAQYGIEIIIPRLSRVYGPTMQKTDSKAVAQFIKKAVQGEDIVLKSDGTQLYSYCYSIDAATGILTALLLGESGQAYNVSDSRSELMLKELASLLAAEAGSRVIYEIPDDLEQSGYSRATKAVLDSGKLEGLGWKPLTPIAEGLKKTISLLSSGMEE